MSPPTITIPPRITRIIIICIFLGLSYPIMVNGLAESEIFVYVIVLLVAMLLWNFLNNRRYTSQETEVYSLLTQRYGTLCYSLNIPLGMKQWGKLIGVLLILCYIGTYLLSEYPIYTL